MSWRVFTVRDYEVRQDGGGEFFHGDFLSVVVINEKLFIITKMR